MFRSLLLLWLGVGMAACSGAAPAPRLVHEGSRAPEPRVSSAPPAPQADACRAEPSTVYGDEAVKFEIEGPVSTAPVAAKLFDDRGRLVLDAQAPLPGQWRPPAVASGDFRLQLGSNGVSCVVTVNRELSRATQLAR